MKKMTIFVTAIILLFAMCLSVNAQNVDGTIQPLWDNIRTVNCELSFNNSRNAVVVVSIIGQSGTTSIDGSLTLYKGTGDDKTYETSWEFDENLSYLRLSETGPVCESGETYTLELNATVYKDGYGEDIFFSDVAYCP